ncbi:30S ribosomal protein S3ae [Methanocorpusculum sp.]|nr:30S ribosomal protein S3ae [Methanocorpusculum parvum]MBO5118897.1 30S ribosomal protein S3ae [Methanocorpusculum sp.]MBO5368292.1 30S ribosomal protein S3ae [Methanocorpusculum sp.]MBO5431526.1 30S ribosomal protein S3ae [Methanocorpusculum sp.]MBQ2771573.1 30S ribosomal protein S3ae [Methanocorpusculum sp.]
MARKKASGGRKLEGWKAKSWFKVYAPEFLGKQLIGEIVSSNPENIPGRVMTVSLGELIQDYSKMNVRASFKINEVAGDAAYTQFHGHEMAKEFVRAMVKRRATRIDSTLTVKPLGSAREIQVTVTAFTISHARLSQAQEIRATMVKTIEDFAKEADFESFTSAMLKGELSKKMFEVCKPIFPVKRIEVIKSESVSSAADRAAALRK